MGWSERREGWRDARVADAYDARRFRTPMQRAKHANDARLVQSLLARVGEGLHVLDAPTGTGRMVGDLLAAGHRVTGVDLSTAMLAHAAAGEGHEGFRGHAAGEIERLPFRDNAFDAAISLRFLFHAKDRAVRIALYRELARVAPVLVAHVRARGTFKHGSRWLRSRVGASRRYRPAPSRAATEAELREAGWRLETYAPVSRVFSDKALVLALHPRQRMRQQ